MRPVSPCFPHARSQARLAAVTGALCALVIVALAATSYAGPPEPGKLYQGPQSFDVPTLGLRFELPKGYVGALDGDVFAVRDPSDVSGSSIVFLWSELGSASDAKAKMSAPLPLSGIVLTPTGKVARKKDLLAADYSVTGAGALSRARIVARSQHGRIVAAIALFAPKAKKDTESLQRVLFAKIRIDKPKKAQASTGSGEWVAWLKGARLTRFYNGSGYSEKESYTFCPDGSFSRSFGATSVSGNGSGAASSGGSGRWSASGEGNTGAIVLTYNDGSVERTTIEYKDKKTFWRGKRYFYEANKCQ